MPRRYGWNGEIKTVWKRGDRARYIRESDSSWNNKLVELKAPSEFEDSPAWEVQVLEGPDKGEFGIVLETEIERI